MSTFPTKPQLSQGESPSLYDITPVTSSLKAPTDSGFEFRRPTNTRPLLYQVQTGFLSLPHEDYLKLSAFYATHTDVVAFTYFDYLHGVSRLVRFDEFKPSYKGVGTNRMWDIKIKMSEF